MLQNISWFIISYECLFAVAAIRIVCGRACRLRPRVLSPLPCKSLRPCALLLRATRITADAMRIVCGRECCRRRRRACRLWPCMLPLPPPPRVSSVAVHVATAAARVICGHACCRRRRACRLWPCASPLWAMRVAPGPTVQSCNRKK